MSLDKASQILYRPCKPLIMLHSEGPLLLLLTTEECGLKSKGEKTDLSPSDPCEPYYA
jgi:hypothetical protein